MNIPTMDQITDTMQESERMWLTMCDQCDEARVDMLMHAMIEQHALVMEGETNANALMSLVGFMSAQVMALH